MIKISEIANIHNQFVENKDGMAYVQYISEEHVDELKEELNKQFPNRGFCLTVQTIDDDKMVMVECYDEI